MTEQETFFEHNLFSWKNVALTFVKNSYWIKVRVNIYINWWLKEFDWNFDSDKLANSQFVSLMRLIDSLWYNVPTEYDTNTTERNYVVNNFNFKVYNATWYEIDNEFSKNESQSVSL